jgi:hypothetical protein
VERSPTDATHIDDTAIMRPDCDFESAPAASGPIDEKPPAAIHAPNIPEATISQDTFAVPATDGAAIVEACSDLQADRNGFSGSGHDSRRREA